MPINASLEADQLSNQARLAETGNVKRLLMHRQSCWPKSTVKHPPRRTSTAPVWHSCMTILDLRELADHHRTAVL